MKKIFKILFIVIALALVMGFISLQDNKENIIEYQNYAENLQSFETEFGTMKYSDQGEGQAILLVHGVPTNSWMYRNLSQELVDNGYRVIAPDLMGFGKSDRMEKYDNYDFDNQATLLFDLMESLEINSWEQLTHDMGGLVTWNMARIAPEKISHLYILNTILYAETFNPPADFNYDNKLHRWFLGLHAHPMVGKLIVNNMLRAGTGGHTFTNAERAGYWLPIRDGAGVLVHFFTHSAEVKEKIDEYRSWLINSKIPVSVIWGEDDPFLDSSSAYLLQEEMNIADKDVIILKDKKHLVAEESYQEIANHIINHK
jgi:pimeloyl-ACP methyl ester carboxylesterase